MLAFFLLVIVFISSAAILITGDVDEKMMLDEIDMMPSNHDLLLMDLPVKKLKMRTKEIFEFDYNSAHSGIGAFPIHGVILEDTKLRLIIPIVATYKKNAIKTTCVLDTGSLWNFFSAETFQTLGLDHVSVSAQISLQGLPLPVYRSANHFVDINVCGQSFLSAHLLRLVADYRKRKVILEKTSDLTPQDIEDL